MPAKEGDQRAADPDENLIKKLTNVCASLVKRKNNLKEHYKEQIRELISWMKDLLK